MKYQDHVLQAFGRLGMTPRPGQAEAVNSILTEFIDNGKRNVILCAPTGTGKSLIGAAAAEALSTIRVAGNVTGPRSSLLLSATNALLRQYSETFEKTGVDHLVLKGASNYECSALQDGTDIVTADNCAWFTMVQDMSSFTPILDEHCSRCEYKAMKDRRNTTRHVITNYSYYFIDRMYTQKFEQRDLVVWDEAHLLNDLFSEHNTIHFSVKLMQQTAMEISENVQVVSIEVGKILKKLITDLAIKDKINESNYDTYLNMLVEVYEFAKERGTKLAERAIKAGNMKVYTRINNFVKKYEGRLCKISDFFEYAYDHVFEHNFEEQSVTIKPIFVAGMMDCLEAANYNLFMSATVTDDFMNTTLGLGAQTTAFIKLGSQFPKENKSVVFFNPLSLNYTSMQNPQTLQSLASNISKIFHKHASDGDRGIILTPSFKITQLAADAITADAKKHGVKVFQHKSGEKLELLLNEFKAYSGKAVLLSPSMFEGIDLPGDLSRYQILVKAPYPSLGDKRMKFIADNHGQIYRAITLMKCVQGAGRSVRSADDWAVTYILDQNMQKLWSSKQNVWKDEFSTKFTSEI